MSKLPKTSRLNGDVFAFIANTTPEKKQNSPSYYDNYVVRRNFKSRRANEPVCFAPTKSPETWENGVLSVCTIMAGDLDLGDLGPKSLILSNIDVR